MRNNKIIRSIVWKELRETVPLATVGLLVGLFVVSQGMLGVFPWSTTYEYSIPFVYADGALSMLNFVASVLGIALGLRQSVWESHTGTYLFLLHRPLKRQNIIAVKLGVGLLVYAVAMAIPILAYGMWAATPGAHASPFFWSMTLSEWEKLVILALFYLGAFLSGLGSGRWYGSRLLPLAAFAAAAGVLTQSFAYWPLLCSSGLISIVVFGWLAIVRTSDTREFA